MSKLLRKIKKFIPVLSEPTKKMPELPRAQPCHVKPIMLKSVFEYNISDRTDKSRNYRIEALKDKILSDLKGMDLFTIKYYKEDFIEKIELSLMVLPEEPY